MRKSPLINTIVCAVISVSIAVLIAWRLNLPQVGTIGATLSIFTVVFIATLWINLTIYQDSKEEKEAKAKVDELSARFGVTADDVYETNEIVYDALYGGALTDAEIYKLNLPAKIQGFPESVKADVVSYIGEFGARRFGKNEAGFWIQTSKITDPSTTSV